MALRNRWVKCSTGSVIRAKMNLCLLRYRRNLYFEVNKFWKTKMKDALCLKRSPVRTSGANGFSESGCQCTTRSNDFVFYEKAWKTVLDLGDPLEKIWVNTWRKQKKGFIRVRLDHFKISTDWQRLLRKSYWTAWVVKKIETNDQPVQKKRGSVSLRHVGT